MEIEALDGSPIVSLNQLTVQLSAPGTAPALINPDFLYHNGVVEAGWGVERPVTIESSYSNVNYSNGLSFTASDRQLTVAQHEHPLSTEDIVCPAVVNRYLEVAPRDLEYRSVSINFLGSVGIGEDREGKLFSPLHQLALDTSLRNVIPELQVRGLYRLEEKSITFYIVERRARDSGAVQGLGCRAEIRRRVSDDTSEGQSAFIRSVLDDWQQDLNDFNDLAYKFYAKYVPEEA